MKINVGRMAGGGEQLKKMQEKKDRIKGADTERKGNQKGHKETEKERKDTVNIHRRTQGERSHHILLQNPGKLSYLGLVRFI